MIFSRKKKNTNNELTTKMISNEIGSTAIKELYKQIMNDSDPETAINAMDKAVESYTESIIAQLSKKEWNALYQQLINDLEIS